jgi:hypothetical protein
MKFPGIGTILFSTFIFTFCTFPRFARFTYSILSPATSVSIFEVFIGAPFGIAM